MRPRVRQPLHQRASPEPNVLAGWDIGLAAFAMACMTAGFWRLWPGAVSLTDAPLGPMILKSGLAALGFVAIASRWEEAIGAIVRNPLMLVLMALACASAVWAIAPADALRNAITLIVMWVFGIAIALRFRPRDLAEICAFAGLFSLMAQFVAHKSMPPVDRFDGDLAFAIIGNVWAAWRVPARRPLWLLAAGGCAMLAFAAGDLASFGAANGLFIGFGLAKFSALKGRQGTISIIVTAWALVALIIGVTVFALFGADPVSANIVAFFTSLGPNMMIGQGFGMAGQSFSHGLGAGLGIVGVALGALIVMATLFQSLFNNANTTHGGEFNVAVWVASLCAILASPDQVAIFGPVSILFFAMSFSISLSSIAVKQPREALMSSKERGLPPKTSRPVHSQNSKIGQSGQISNPVSPALNNLGLRSKI